MSILKSFLFALAIAGTGAASQKKCSRRVNKCKTAKHYSAPAIPTIDYNTVTSFVYITRTVSISSSSSSPTQAPYNPAHPTQAPYNPAHPTQAPYNSNYPYPVASTSAGPAYPVAS
ncbi:hypothetical protein AYI69_g8298, partial [Smittium culicis]